MKNISKRIRDEAVLICAIGASGKDYVCVADIESDLDRPDYYSDAGELACRAYHSETARTWPMFSPERYAEAEALLRTGWTP